MAREEFLLTWAKPLARFPVAQSHNEKKEQTSHPVAPTVL